jgi:hypothetical protein
MFCPNSSSLDIWQDKGIPLCLFNLLSASVPFGFIFMFGTIQIWFYGYFSVWNVTGLTVFDDQDYFKEILA